MKKGKWCVLDACYTCCRTFLFALICFAFLCFVSFCFVVASFSMWRSKRINFDSVEKATSESDTKRIRVWRAQQKGESSVARDGRRLKTTGNWANAIVVRCRVCGGQRKRNVSNSLEIGRQISRCFHFCVTKGHQRSDGEMEQSGWWLTRDRNEKKKQKQKQKQKEKTMREDGKRWWWSAWQRMWSTSTLITLPEIERWQQLNGGSLESDHASRAICCRLPTEHELKKKRKLKNGKVQMYFFFL